MTRRPARYALVLLAVLAVWMPPGRSVAQRRDETVHTASGDLAAARSLFEANLDAIRRRDRDAYLACYLRSEGLARTGPTGIAFGYAALDSSAGRGWPDQFEALDLRLAPVGPGV